MIQLNWKRWRWNSVDWKLFAAILRLCDLDGLQLNRYEKARVMVRKDIWAFAMVFPSGSFQVLLFVALGFRIHPWWELMGPIGNAQAVLASGGRWGISGGQLSMAPRAHGLWGRPKEPAALLPSLAAGGELWFHRLMEPKIHPNGAVGAVSFQRLLLNLIRSTSIHVYFLWLG